MERGKKSKRETARQGELELKILYISPEHTVGALSLWKREHEKRGNECRFVTLYRSASGFEEDICLDLPLVSAGKLYDKLRNFVYRSHGELGSKTVKEGFPPVWSPSNRAESIFFKMRESIWSRYVEKAIIKYGLSEFDIYHLEWGMEFYRDGRFITEMKKEGKHIVCTYHGQDMRNRGVIPAIDALSDLNLTSELDLMQKHPDINYLFLPFDTSEYEPRREPNDLITVAHASRNRRAKGSDDILRICTGLEREGKIKFLFLEDRPHSEVLEAKARSDIYIDQITDIGWGYGMNSVEALSMGAVCFTKMNERYNKFIPDHPFVNVSAENLKSELAGIIADRDKLKGKMIESREWVVKQHDIVRVMDKLYEYYRKIGIQW